jgi:hypothetical protein
METNIRWQGSVSGDLKPPMIAYLMHGGAERWSETSTSRWTRVRNARDGAHHRPRRLAVPQSLTISSAPARHPAWYLGSS